MLTHGHARGYKVTATYNSWSNMLCRCDQPARPDYCYYGGKGVTICPRWRTFENFLADMGERPQGTTLHRLENEKGYQPDNCVWATPFEQNQHSSNCRWLDYNGERMLLTRWAERLGIAVSSLNHRLKRGWPISRALTEVPRRRNLPSMKESL